MPLPQLASELAKLIRADRMPPGTRLPERKLAARLRLSRSPVHAALKALHDRQIVVLHPSGGYAVGEKAHSPDVPAAVASGPSDDELLYLRIADDHLSALLPTLVTENALIRRYGLARGKVARALRRAAHEGWAERLPGYGWAFRPVLNSAEAYAQSYRFRILVEPAAILEPSFVLDRAALERCNAEQQGLAESGGAGLSAPELFDIGSRFHEVVIRCCGNAFLIDGLLRVNRLRRLMEYRKIVDRSAWLARCQEHVRLSELLLEGDRVSAAALLRRHLETGANRKSTAKF